MSSKDLNGIELLPEFFAEQIDSIKVEGRMRSILYAGLISKAYREALDYYFTHKAFPAERLKDWDHELVNIPHREYMTGSLHQPADHGSVLGRDFFTEDAHFDFIGIIRKVVHGRYLLVEVKRSFEQFAEVEVVPYSGRPITLTIHTLFTSIGAPVLKTEVNQLVHIPSVDGAEVGNIVRRAQLKATPS